jgi:hypothetical protein
MKKLTANDLLRDGVFFCLKEKSSSQISICMAESLEEAGIPVSSNINYYEKSYDDNSFLFNKNKILPGDAALILLDISFMSNGLSIVELPSVLVQNQNKMIFISSSDLNPMIIPSKLVPSTSDAIPIIATHENIFYRLYNNRRIPWGFGITKKDLFLVNKNMNTNKRKRTILRNFTASSNQDVRNSLDLFLLQNLIATFEIDSEINYTNHFSRLSKYLMCATYGGTYYADLFQQKNSHFTRNYEKQADCLKNPVILRWDSYRTGQTMASGCAAIHLDYDECGFKLPCDNPKNWIEYIGISPNNICDDIKKIKELSNDEIQEIGARGKEWFLAKFSPMNLSEILIDILTTPEMYYI